MTLTSEGFTSASTAMHALPGAGLLALFLAEAIPAGEEARRKLGLAASLALALSGAASFAAMLHILGGWSVSGLVTALGVKKGFYLYIAFSCYYASAGLARFMHLATDGQKQSWYHISLVFLAAAGGLYFTLGSRVNEEAAGAVGSANSAIGAALLAALAFKVLHGFFRHRALHLAWAALLLAASLQLLAYREDPGAFRFRMITLESGPEAAPSPVNPMQVAPAPFRGIPLEITGPSKTPPPAKKNAKPADKERAGR